MSKNNEIDEIEKILFLTKDLGKISSEVGSQKYIKLFGGTVDYWKNVDLETIVKGTLKIDNTKMSCEICKLNYYRFTKNNGYFYIMCKCGIFHDEILSPKINKYKIQHKI